MSDRKLDARIVKVGGSLLDCPSLPEALQNWLAQQSPATNVLICGGGEVAETIHRADQAFSLGEEKSHWLAMDAMSLTARLLAAILGSAPPCENIAELHAAMRQPQPTAVLFDPAEFLGEHEPRLPGVPLPRTWQVTSDSIAARIAEVLAADELVLLKSSDPPAATLPELSARGYVDPHFRIAAASLAAVRFVNLRQWRCGSRENSRQPSPCLPFGGQDKVEAGATARPVCK